MIDRVYGARAARRFIKRLDRCAISVRQRYFDKFTFIHINKTGGSSIEKALRIQFEHKTALEKIEELGRSRWNRRFSFAFVRNPWDKVVSHYHYRVATNQTELGVNPVDFREWVKLSYRDRHSFYYDNPRMFMPQLDWIADSQGCVLVDFVGRFERLQDDFSEVCRTLDLEASLPHVKSTRHDSYRDYYDGETAQVVAECFDRDIVHFGYDL